MPAQNNLIFNQNWFNNASPLNYYRALPVYLLPSSLTIKKLLELVQIGNFNLNYEKFSEIVMHDRTLKCKLTLED